jgi:hypothetical protein
VFGQLLLKHSCKSGARSLHDRNSPFTNQQVVELIQAQDWNIRRSRKKCGYMPIAVSFDNGS